MRVVITWSDGATTTLSEVKNVREPLSSHPCYKIEGRVSQTLVNPAEVKSVEVWPTEEEV